MIFITKTFKIQSLQPFLFLCENVGIVNDENVVRCFCIINHEYKATSDIKWYVTDYYGRPSDEDDEWSEAVACFA